VPATHKVLGRAELKMDEIDLVEINEAFAAQVLACNAELKIDENRLNVNGGAVALGHPLGCSGARLMVTLTHEMRRRGAPLGLVDDVHRDRPRHRDGGRAKLMTRTRRRGVSE
jgi:acetyl-CoA acetyltransferase